MPSSTGRIGYRIGKVQKKAFDEIKVLRAKGLERRADNPPPADQRRMAWVFSANDRFVNSFGGGRKPRSSNQKTRGCRECAACMSNRNHQHPANQTEITTDVAVWTALWYPEIREFPQRLFPDRAPPPPEYRCP